MMMTTMGSRVLALTLALTLTLSGSAARAEPGLADLSTDPAFVVELHASRAALDGVQLPENARRQVMTTATGQQFECFLPALSAGEYSGEEDEDGASAAADEGERAFLAFGRAASRQVRPKCVQFVDGPGDWVYEVCPGVLVRKVGLKGQVGDEQEPQSHRVVELGAFRSDASAPALAFSDFVGGAETQARVGDLQKPLYTQRFVGADEDEPQLLVQFMCSAVQREDAVAGVQWSPTAADSQQEQQQRTAVGFLVASRAFCNPVHSDVDDESEDLLSVRALLQPLVAAGTCVKRNEGWWTYEVCFGQGVRQYHRDSDGRVTAEFSLGSLDAERNAELERSGGALVSEHVDATHDVARPAFLELYGHGTFCKEFDNHAPREARVYYYCSQGGTSHHILTVKEVQTCSYTIKVSSPVLCDHPHFINDDLRGSDRPEVVHCVPVEADAAAVE